MEVCLGRRQYWPAKVLCVCGYGQNAIFHLELFDGRQRLSVGVLQIRPSPDVQQNSATSSRAALANPAKPQNVVIVSIPTLRGACTDTFEEGKLEEDYVSTELV